ncbi:MAG: DUF4292 domain-containing protein [Bacteroidota bacterium]|jgi:hypothetical protein|nr:DUF4292 domain-containing protein [Bacteroidota bacterium]
MNRTIYGCLIFYLIFIFSCRRPQTGVDYDYLDKNKLEVQEIEFTYFSSKAKIQYQDINNNVSANANLRIKKDSIIWFSITPALGIEAARGIITQDSIIIINRLNKEYVVYDFATISQKFNFNIDYYLLQAILLGNMPLEKNPDALVSREQNFYHIKQEEGNISADNYISARTMKVEKVQMVQEPDGNTLSLQYNNFNMVDQYAMPFSSLISLNYKTEEGMVNTLLNLDFNKAEIVHTPLSFPFSIPSKYERK